MTTSAFAAIASVKVIFFFEHHEPVRVEVVVIRFGLVVAHVLERNAGVIPWGDVFQFSFNRVAYIQPGDEVMN